MPLPCPSTDPGAAALAERLRARQWRVVESGCGSASWNMAVDEALLQSAALEEAPPTLRFYTWSPYAVSLGRFQTTEGIDLAYARERGWDLVRRPTGGRAVLHALEVTYSLVLPPSLVRGAGVRASYSVLTGWLNSGLRRLVGEALPAHPAAPGADGGRCSRQPNCFALSGECDTLVPQGKLVGSAQARREGALLQHGSILLDAEPEHWARLFGEPGRLATLRMALGRTPEPAEVHDAVMRGFGASGAEFAPGELSEDEVREAEGLVARYACEFGCGETQVRRTACG